MTCFSVFQQFCNCDTLQHVREQCNERAKKIKRRKLNTVSGTICWSESEEMKHQHIYTLPSILFPLTPVKSRETIYNWTETNQSQRYDMECWKTALSFSDCAVEGVEGSPAYYIQWNNMNIQCEMPIFSGWPRGLAGWLWSMVADNRPIAEGHNLVLVCWWQCEAAASNGAVIGHYSCGERLKASLPLFVLTSLFYSHHTLLHFPSLWPARL